MCVGIIYFDKRPKLENFAQHSKHSTSAGNSMQFINFKRSNIHLHTCIIVPVIS